MKFIIYSSVIAIAASFPAFALAGKIIGNG